MENIALDEFRRQPINDAPASDIGQDEKIRRSRILDNITRKLQELATGNFSVNMAAQMVSRCNEQNKRTIESNFRVAFGIDVKNLLSNRVVRQTLEQSVYDNVNLITSIKNDFISDIGGHIRESITSGRRHTDMIRLIRERGEVTESRARLIARDQTAKINADLTRERHKAFGITLYYWGGANDERQRGSHSKMNGLLCQYDDPTVYSDDDGKTWKKRTSEMVKLHPGEDFQCRCYGRPHVQIEIDEAA